MARVENSLLASLHAYQVIDWVDPNTPRGIETHKVFVGPDANSAGFQVAVATSRGIPSKEQIRNLYSRRRGRRTIFVVVAVTYQDKVWLYGPDEHSNIEEMPVSQAIRYLQSVLDEPDVLAAHERISSLRQANESTTIAGLTNSGLFASYHLRENVPQRPDWVVSTQSAELLLLLREKRLIDALGFRSTPDVGRSLILTTTNDAPRAVAILLTSEESFDAEGFSYQLSPVAFGLALAAKKNAPWLIVLRKDQIRLYPGRDGVGVGQKGQADTFFEIDLAALDIEYQALLPLIFSADALSDGGSTEQILNESSKFASALGVRLRERIYESVVPTLAKAVVAHLPQLEMSLDAQGLTLAYRISLRILFRLLFQAYAEDRGLLPSGRNERYDASSLKTAAQRDLETTPESFSTEASSLWLDLKQVWDAIDKGNSLWQVPAYNGGLFSTDIHQSLEGYLIEQLCLPDSVIGPVLQSLLVDTSEDGIKGPVDFRSLSVREFGTIYEGLLDSSLSLAEQDLTLSSEGIWIPAQSGDTVEAKAGEPFFQTASGERKATGTYYTPKMIVDHLVERSVTPALEAHLEKIKAYLAEGAIDKAEREFFDFRVADLAMGSGHFLVAAVDKIESLMRTFLTEHKIPGVTNELLRLAKVAKEALQDDYYAQSQVEEIGLLRRQIARRCVYGLDINPLSVELARLALWIHTFVPGLPMSNLDHNLICANSLTGIGVIDEAMDLISPYSKDRMTSSYASGVMEDNLLAAKELLIEASAASEANKAEIENAAKLYSKAKIAAQPVKGIFDAAVALRVEKIKVGVILGKDELDDLTNDPGIPSIIEQLQPAHFPYLFPEVFLRSNPGFDATIGNPPWETIKIEEWKWWGLQIPRLRSMPEKRKRAELDRIQGKRLDLLQEYNKALASSENYRRILISGPFPGLGAGGDIDLYQAFSWRNWQLLRRGGRSGIVLPRMALSGSTLRPWRKDILACGSFPSVCFLVNHGGWVFEGVHNSYTVGLTVIAKDEAHSISISGPFTDDISFSNGCNNSIELSAAEFSSWSDTLAFPLTPDNTALELLRKLKESPRFGETSAGWEFRPIKEIDETNDRALLDFTIDDKGGRTPVLKGASFNLWNPDFSDVFAYTEPQKIRARLREKLRRGQNSRRSAYFGLKYPQSALPMDFARISYRWVTRATDARTMRCCLIPPGSVAVSSAPVFVRRAEDTKTEAYLLGILSSIPFDWQARLSVELNFTFEILNDLTIPKYINNSLMCKRVVEISGRLAAVDERYAEWAAEVGVPVGSVSSQVEKDKLIAELDALVSLLYGLSEEQVSLVFSTFHRGWDYQSRLEAVLAYYRRWEVEQ